MLSLIILILFGIGVAFFATQNTQLTNLVVGPYGFTDVPLYTVVVGSILFGIFVSWIVSLFGFVSTSMTIRSKDGKIRNAQSQIEKLEQENHELESENAVLRDETHMPTRHESITVEEKRHINPFVKLRQLF